MSVRFQLRFNSEAGAVPTQEALIPAELALCLGDGKLYALLGDGQVHQIAGIFSDRIPSEAGSALAGATGEIADAGHVHPATSPTPSPTDNSRANATTEWVRGYLNASGGRVTVSQAVALALSL